MRRVFISLLLFGVLFEGCSCRPERTTNPPDVETTSNDDMEESDSKSSAPDEQPAASEPTEVNGAENDEGSNTTSEENTGQSSDGGQGTDLSGGGQGSNADSAEGHSSIFGSSTLGGAQASGPGERKFSSAEQALAYGEQMTSQARELAQDDRFEAAYRQARSGWQAMRSFKADEKCQDSSRKLLALMEEYGEQIEEKGGEVLRDVKLKIR